MATNKDFSEGVAIIAKYIPDGSKYDVNAEHDQIWFGKKEWITNSEDLKKLDELGWFIDIGEELLSCWA